MKKIAIIGAGISGLFLANLLEKDKTFKYKIFEKRNSLDFKDGYGIQLSTNSVKILNNIGFQQMNVSDVCFPKKVNFFDAKNLKKICDIDISKFNDDTNRYTTLKRSKLLEFLFKNIPQQNIFFNSDLSDIKSDNRILLKFREKEIEEFDYLVAADGVYSKTKKILFKKNSLPEYFNSVALRGKISNFNNPDISLYLGPNFHFVIYPINQNKEYNFILILRKKLIEEKMLDKELFKNKNFIQNVLNQVFSKSKLILSEQIKEIKCFPIFISREFQIPSFKNIFLVGDAFYSTPPSFAQGASQSIEAGNELFNELKNNTSNYYKIRVSKIKKIDIRSKLNHFAFHLSNPINILLRNIFLKYLSKNKKFLKNYLGKIYNN